MKLNKIQTIFDPVTGAKLLTVKEASVYLKYDPVSIRRLVVRGDLQPYSRMGNNLLFLQEELERFKYTSLWAMKKANVRFIPNPPPSPSTKRELQAVVTVNVKRKNVVFQRLETFRWEDVPAIRARVDRKFGKTSFQITVEAPDGCGYEIRFSPSIMEVEHYNQLPSYKKKGKTPYLIG